MRGSDCILKHFFQLAAGEYFKRVGVHAAYEVLVGGVGVGVGEQVAVLPDLGVNAVVCIDPVYRRALDLAAVCGISAAAVGIVGCQDFGDIAVFVLHAAGAGDEVRTLKTALGTAGIQAFVLGNGRLEKILALYPELTGEAYLAGAGVGIVGVVLDLKLLTLPLGVVGDGELYRL